MAPLTHYPAVLSRQAGACPPAQDIINAAATAEALAVTFLGEALALGALALDDEQAGAFAAARAEEQAHYEYLAGAGAQAATRAFTLPDARVVTDLPAFLAAVIDLEEALVAAYLAAAQELTHLGEPDLARVAMQIGAVEAEHRALARFYALAAGWLADVPNDVAFSRARFASTTGVVDALRELGWIDGAGPVILYPGPGEIDFAGVVRLEP